MARTTSYGMGQYRYNNSYTYINKFDIPNESYQPYENNGYEDVYIKLPTTTDNNSVVQYGRTFYVRLTIPQNNQYTLKLNLKLCSGNSGGSTDSLNINRFQQIRQLIVPPTPNLNDDAFSPVILYEVPVGEGYASGDHAGDVKVHLWDSKHRYNLNDAVDDVFSSHNAGEIYFEKNNEGKEEYRYYISSSNNFRLLDDQYFTPILPQSWKLKESNNSTITYDFIFSPKYNLTGGYPYLFIETDRSNIDQQSIQYIGDDGETYYGTKFDIDKIKLELYYVSNLLEKGSAGQAQIQSGTDTLTHIGIWGHPEQLFAINGEEIRIGQSGFYELNDFTISQLGVVVDPDNPIKDRFTIDYEYKIIS